MAIVSNLPPWLLRAAKRGFTKLRAKFFTVDAGRKQLTVDASVEELRDVLGQGYFTNGWELSYHYRGEDMNMRRPLWKDDSYEWYQTHLRGFDNDDETVTLSIHEDLEPTEWPYLHLHPSEDVNLDDKAAVADVKRILDDAGISYTEN